VNLDGPPSSSVPRSPDFDGLDQHAACGLLTTSPAGLILQANRTFCDWIGRSADDLVGRIKLQELFTMGGRIFHQTHWAPLLQLQGSVSEVKLALVHANGESIPIVLNAVRREVDGAVHHDVAVFVAEDRHRYERELILARTRAEELLAKEKAMQQELAAALAERDRQKIVAQDRALFAEQMMAIVSHDLRNPLSVIRMSGTLIGMGELSDGQQRALERLSRSTARATRLISDLLDFSQARMGSGLRVDLEPLDLHAAVADAVQDLQLAFDPHKLIHLSVGEGTCLASGDRLTQLIGNLVSNAVAYGVDDRPVTITSRVGHDEFSLMVHNEGPVIPPELLPTLFDAMTRGDAKDHGSHSVGLGLFIVREIARAHGGVMEVRSAAGAGTAFKITFPHSKSQHSLPSKRPTEALQADELELARQAELDRLCIAEFEEAAYDDITRLAAEVCDVPMALVSIVDRDRQWFKSRLGIQVKETPREHAFCDYTIREITGVMVVEDAAIDPRFASNPLVTGEPNIRFYAGAPLVTSNGHALGTVCVIDRKPRKIGPDQVEILRFLAQQVVAKMEERGGPLKS
jgi:sigma-B regulation protein RsbU (phosphoserine phosphatase)